MKHHNYADRPKGRSAII